MLEAELEARYLQKIVERYKDYVNLNEQKSIPDLKALASPKQADAVRLAEKLGTVEAAFDFVSALDTVHMGLPVSFWLDLSDVVQLGAGDALDKARLLCGVLGALGKTSWIRVVRLSQGGQHALVWLDEKPVRVFDAVHGKTWTGDSVEDALERYPVPHAIGKSLYEFNADAYREL
ncbi:hypothetical protein HY572_00510 [Candidatus Micrarchaeota archaeon]|nr:hypothetical protein [Candidatus Micrarchaeota archaeon]